MQYVGVGRRLVAALVDGLIVLGGLGFAIAALAGKTSSTPHGFEFHLEGGLALVLFALWFMYYLVLEALLGATIGKLLVGVRVRTTDGDRIGWTASIARNVLRAFDVGLCFIGAALIWTSPRRQRLGDWAANTVVVQLS